MTRIPLFLTACAALVVAVEKPSPTPRGMISLTSEVKSGQTYITAKIPHGQSLQISCPQKDNEAQPSVIQFPGKGPAKQSAPIQTVQIVGAKYQVPRGAKNSCHSSNAKFLKEIKSCSSQTSTTCIVTSNDPSKEKGCEKRRLGITYICGTALPPPTPFPPGVVGLMVNNMIDDFD